MTTLFPTLNNKNSAVALIENNVLITYSDLNEKIDRFAKGLLGSESDLNEERVAFFIPASEDYVTTLHGIWRAGGIAVPLNVASAVTELDHYLKSANVTRMIASGKYKESLKELCSELGVELIDAQEILNRSQHKDLPAIDQSRRAMMLFTSGTTSKPKGVVSTHAIISSQITTLIDAWEWTSSDVVPLFLPLHHIHGIINILSCGLWSGATIDLYQNFDITRVCASVAAENYNVFMAVPTIYVKLIQHICKLPSSEKDRICAGFSSRRLNISGSAACPVKLFNEWKTLTSQTLLERYGMTEIGMGISNPYHGERRPGHVGQALPGVDIQLFDDEDNLIDAENVAGEIRVQGDNVFLEYWDNASATEESFIDGWFCTGDVAVLDNGYYRIMGRSSIDIIKSGGYKLSALEIEGTLLTHENILEVAVLGTPDETWGEAVTAFVVLKPASKLDYQDLKNWCDGRMSAYKMPKILHILESLPRNAMGKVTKVNLKDCQ